MIDVNAMNNEVKWYNMLECVYEATMRTNKESKEWDMREKEKEWNENCILLSTILT